MTRNEKKEKIERMATDFVNFVSFHYRPALQRKL